MAGDPDRGMARPAAFASSLCLHDDVATPPGLYLPTPLTAGRGLSARAGGVKGRRVETGGPVLLLWVAARTAGRLHSPLPDVAGTNGLARSAAFSAARARARASASSSRSRCRRAFSASSARSFSRCLRRAAAFSAFSSSSLLASAAASSSARCRSSSSARSEAIYLCRQTT